jgi:hypothetical protein
MSLQHPPRMHSSHTYPYAHTGRCGACHIRSEPAHTTNTYRHTPAHTSAHTSVYRRLTMPHTLHTPEPCTTHTRLTHTLPQCPHMSLLCLPHSFPTCKHGHHIVAYISMHLPIDALPYHICCAHLGPALHTHMPPSQPSPRCPHMPLLCLPHTISGHTQSLHT